MTEAGTHDIEIRDLYKIFGPEAGRHVEAVKAGLTKTELNDRHNHVLGLQDINLTIPHGRITVIMGLSGSGKSTLIRHINGLIRPTAGQVLYDGLDVVTMTPAQLRDFRRQKTAMVFQKFALLPHRTVLRNVAYGLDIRGIAEAEERARHWIGRVGLQGYEEYYPRQLSGGMQQRVGLARALANDAEILLMDEAFSALDPLIRMDMQSILLELQQELRKTIIFITHDLDEALRLGDKIAILRDGAMEQVGDGQEIVLRPANAYIAEFVREVNRGRIIEARTIAAPAAEGRELPGFAVKARSRLDLVARRMTKAGVSEAQVRDGDRLVGIIDLPSILEAMVNPADAASDD
ncbi:ATP-binding cassette domain-containing protein [Paracoccus versutus]|uniref:Trimethylamine N-oxide transport system ATP-binding protein TmoW n=1 Tax=Paracoccus versutus TaxID=34007 RepID=A0A099FHM6_PARVE|nr:MULTISPECIES: ATP-binding cassette domain-containing protein [Paracoccus]WGR59414.1 ATP-binding cassette domain-containing protein [Paracoccus ferrooxidans]SFX75298.1 glycine betaine/proline transport system ATP-binding protein [Paracoccus pantotrophus]KGJ09771.1 glycine/betaine ABC transporter ATPase [Paracoccus versutus]MBT0778927.1 ATP-binding cassette domain-containing protein [Paracoccus sp. pheM1]MCJ1902866.1 ATP-binding cassette domain-containing protein [Paracoccus versutus]